MLMIKEIPIEKHSKKCSIQLSVQSEVRDLYFRGQSGNPGILDRTKIRVQISKVRTV